VDGKGDLHLKIAKIGGRWICSEVWSDKALGFGTYQCQVVGRLDKLDPNVIFSMFSYDGPDGVKEIDIEYAKWGNPKDKNCWWTVYPEDRSVKKGFTGFDFHLKGVFTTSRYDWTQTGVDYLLLGGHQVPTSSTNLMNSWAYKPEGPSHSVPQHAMPLHFNLWLFQGKPPTDGHEVEIVVHRFDFVAQD
jgi:hypothetical protein